MSPLLLPSNFDNAIDLKEKVVCEIDEPFARSIVAELRNGPASRSRHRKFIYGALYKTLYPGYKLVDLSSEVEILYNRVDIVITLADGTESLVQIGSAAEEKGMLNDIVGLGRALPRSNARQGVGDVGGMVALGYRSTAKATVYAPTLKPEIADAMEVASSSVAKYMQKKWPLEYNDIRRAEKSKSSELQPLKQMGGKDGPGNVIMISKNLGNSSHFDNADKSRSFGIWVEEQPGGAKNWYFILPDVSIDKSKGLVIKLFHGAVITWDGSKIRHCSSMTEPGNNNNVYGCMFGSCR
jgi:hypothetical protein